MVGSLSETIVVCASDPTSFFSKRASVSSKALSNLELIDLMRHKGWQERSLEGGRDGRRGIEPFNVDAGGPLIWYTKKLGETPFREYLLCLLGETPGVKLVYHLQCKSYYKCLAVDPNAQPHQVAQFYKALMRRIARGFQPEGSEPEADLQQPACRMQRLALDDGLMCQESSTVQAGRSGNGNGPRKARKRSAVGSARVPAADPAQCPNADEEAVGAGNNSDCNSDSDAISILSDLLSSEPQDTPEWEPREHAAATTDANTCIDLIDLDPLVDGGLCQNNNEGVGDDQEVSNERLPARPPPMPEALPEALASDNDDAQVVVDPLPAQPLPMPDLGDIRPVRNTAGHQAICKDLLPVLIAVCLEPRWANSEERTQVREACFRNLAALIPEIRSAK